MLPCQAKAGSYAERGGGGNREMAFFTCVIEPGEFLGLSALVEPDRAPDGGDPGADADAVSRAKVLMRTALADKLRGSGPAMSFVRGSSHEVRRRGRESASGMSRIIGNETARKGAAYAVAAALLVVLWGGYIWKWQWTGLQDNNQLWDWLTLLLLPVVLGTIPLWIQYKEYIGKGRRDIYAVAIVAWTGFVIAGYLIPIKWTGFSDVKLWGWLDLLAAPAAVATAMTLFDMAARGAKIRLRPISEGNHRRPGRRVDRYGNRRLRSALDVDRLYRERPMGLARGAPPAGVPDHPASAIGQMGHG